MGLRVCWSRGLPAWRLWLGVGLAAILIAGVWRSASPRRQILSTEAKAQDVAAPAAADLGTDSQATLPAGVFDPADLGRLPGIRPWRTAPTEIGERVRALAEQYDHMLRGVARTFPGAEVPQLSRDSHTPPRMDSGDPDPDRLLAPSLALTGR